MNKRISIRLSTNDYRYLKSRPITISQWVRSAIRRKIHETGAILRRRKVRKTNEPDFKKKCYDETRKWVEKNRTHVRDYARVYMRKRRSKQKRVNNVL
jgi:hypothetical protein